MGTVLAMRDDNDTTPPAPVALRDDFTLQEARRKWRDAEKARARYEAALVTRGAALQAAMDNGWTSREVADAVGVRAINIRNMLSRRRKGDS